MIPKSERNLSRDEYFDIALKLFAEIAEVCKANFGDDKKYVTTIDPETGKETTKLNPDYWLVVDIRDTIISNANDIIDGLTHHSTIYILYEKNYIERRSICNRMLGDIETIKKFCELSQRTLGIKASRFTMLFEDLDYEIELIKRLRSRDNMIFKRDILSKLRVSS